MKNTIIAVLVAYVYQSVCVPSTSTAALIAVEQILYDDNRNIVALSIRNNTKFTRLAVLLILPTDCYFI